MTVCEFKSLIDSRLFHKMRLTEHSHYENGFEGYSFFGKTKTGEVLKTEIGTLQEVYDELPDWVKKENTDEW